jgi:ribosomal protein S18 acetylase RimI-like enzyme
VCEDNKGLIGDLYVARGHDTAANAGLLLSAVLEALFRTPGIARIEAQLMMVHGAFERLPAFARYAQSYARIFMLSDLAEVDTLPASAAADEFRFLEWDGARQDDAAAAIATAYHGHVDSRINDQYRSWPGARRFLSNVIQYPGCGQFLPGASFLSTDRTGRVNGLVLSSLVSADTGHITQVCVTPDARGKALGYELMRRALMTMAGSGCEKTSLTVTASNANAIRLYQSMGFRQVRRFAAYVWEGF